MRSPALHWLCLFLVVFLFAALNLSAYVLVTRRLSGNFSGAGQLHMVDVGRYLPFAEGSDLPELSTEFTVTGDLPVLDGAAALVPVYAALIHNAYPEGCVTYEGGAFSDDNYYGENFAPDSAMQYQNSVRGFEALLDGTVDLFFCAAPSEAQRQQAADAGVELVYVPVGLEAFVFFVNRENPVDGLTTDQIRGIWAGEYRNWAELGGPDRIIHPLTRVPGSGSQSAMEAFMGGIPFGWKYPLAILGASVGYSFRFYLSSMVADDNVKMLSLNGVYPDPENIRSRRYPIVMEFYAAYRADNDNPNLPLILDWLLSEEGQAMIEACGYVGMQ